MMSPRARPLLLAGSTFLLAQCAQRAAELRPEPPPLGVSDRIEASLAAYERGDRDATYHHLASVWRECGAVVLAREALAIAIAAELDPTNPWPAFDRAADFAAVFRGQAIDSNWTAAMAVAFRGWSETLGYRSSDGPGEDRGQHAGGAGPPPPALAASPAPMLHAAVLERAPPTGDGCTVPIGYISPARRITSRSPAPGVVARIVELESARLRLLRDRADLRARVREQERELERLRVLLKP